MDANTGDVKMTPQEQDVRKLCRLFHAHKHDTSKPPKEITGELRTYWDAERERISQDARRFERDFERYFGGRDV